MILSQVAKDFRPIMAGLRVAFPGIYGIGARFQPELFDRLAKRTKRDAGKGPQFDDDAWPQQINQKHRKWDVPSPGGLA